MLSRHGPARKVGQAQIDFDTAGETTVAGRPVVQPVISRRGVDPRHSPGGVDPSDPYPLGHTVSATWGDAFDLMK